MFYILSREFLYLSNKLLELFILIHLLSLHIYAYLRISQTRKDSCRAIPAKLIIDVIYVGVNLV